MHNMSLLIREDLGPSLLHASPAELPVHNDREKGDYSCKNQEMGTVYSRHATFPVLSYIQLLVFPVGRKKRNQLVGGNG